MRYLPEILLIVGVLVCVAAAWLAFGLIACMAVVGVACVGVAFVMDRGGKG